MGYLSQEPRLDASKDVMGNVLDGVHEDLTFSLPRAGIVGIIGPNGAGKTTLFRMLVGQEAPDGGSVEIGETVMLSYVDQSRDGRSLGVTSRRQAG